MTIGYDLSEQPLVKVDRQLKRLNDDKNSSQIKLKPSLPLMFASSSQERTYETSGLFNTGNKALEVGSSPCGDVRGSNLRSVC